MNLKNSNIFVDGKAMSKEVVSKEFSDIFKYSIPRILRILKKYYNNDAQAVLKAIDYMLVSMTKYSVKRNKLLAIKNMLKKELSESSNYTQLFEDDKNQKSFIPNFLNTGIKKKNILKHDAMQDTSNDFMPDIFNSNISKDTLSSQDAMQDTDTTITSFNQDSVQKKLERILAKVEDTDQIKKIRYYIAAGIHPSIVESQLILRVEEKNQPRFYRLVDITPADNSNDLDMTAFNVTIQEVAFVYRQCEHGGGAIFPVFNSKTKVISADEFKQDILENQLNVELMDKFYSTYGRTRNPEDWKHILDSFCDDLNKHNVEMWKKIFDAFNNFEGDYDIYFKYHSEIEKLYRSHYTLNNIKTYLDKKLQNINAKKQGREFKKGLYGDSLYVLKGKNLDNQIVYVTKGILDLLNEKDFANNLNNFNKIYSYLLNKHINVMSIYDIISNKDSTSAIVELQKYIPEEETEYSYIDIVDTLSQYHELFDTFTVKDRVQAFNALSSNEKDKDKYLDDILEKLGPGFKQYFMKCTLFAPKELVESGSLTEARLLSNPFDSKGPGDGTTFNKLDIAKSPNIVRNYLRSFEYTPSNRNAKIGYREAFVSIPFCVVSGLDKGTEYALPPSFYQLVGIERSRSEEFLKFKELLTDSRSNTFVAQRQQLEDFFNLPENQDGDIGPNWVENLELLQYFVWNTFATYSGQHGSGIGYHGAGWAFRPLTDTQVLYALTVMKRENPDKYSEVLELYRNSQARGEQSSLVRDALGDYYKPATIRYYKGSKNSSGVYSYSVDFDTLQEPVKISNAAHGNSLKFNMAQRSANRR